MVQQSPYSCPYSERIARIEALQPDNFAEEWGELRRMVKGTHDSLHDNGYSRRLREMEEEQAVWRGRFSVIKWVVGGGGSLVGVTGGIWAAIQFWGG